MFESIVRDIAGYRIRGVDVKNELHVSVVDICRILGFRGRYVPGDFRRKAIKVKGFYSVLPWSVLYELVCARKWREGTDYNQRVIRFIKTNERYTGTPLVYSDGDNISTPLEGLPHQESNSVEEVVPAVTAAKDVAVAPEESCIIARAVKLLREVSGAKKVTISLEF